MPRERYVTRSRAQNKAGPSINVTASPIKDSHFLEADTSTRSKAKFLRKDRASSSKSNKTFSSTKENELVPKKKRRSVRKLNPRNTIVFDIDTAKEENFIADLPVGSSTPMRPFSNTMSALSNASAFSENGKQKRPALGDISNDLFKRKRLGPSKEAFSKPYQQNETSKSAQDLLFNAEIVVSPSKNVSQNINHSQNIFLHPAAKRSKKIEILEENVKDYETNVQEETNDNLEKPSFEIEEIDIEKTQPLPESPDVYIIEEPGLDLIDVSDAPVALSLQVSEANADVPVDFLPSPEKPEQGDPIANDDELFSLGFLKNHMNKVVTSTIVDLSPEKMKRRTRQTTERSRLRRLRNNNTLPVEGKVLEAKLVQKDTKEELPQKDTKDSGFGSKRKRPRYDDVAVYSMLPPVILISSDDDDQDFDKNKTETANEPPQNQIKEDVESDDDLYFKHTKLKQTTTPQEKSKTKTKAKEEMAPVRQSLRVKEQQTKALDVIPIDEDGNPEYIPETNTSYYNTKTYGTRGESDLSFRSDNNDGISSFDVSVNHERLLPTRTFAAPPVTEVFRRQRIRHAKNTGQLNESAQEEHDTQVGSSSSDSDTSSEEEEDLSDYFGRPRASKKDKPRLRRTKNSSLDKKERKTITIKYGSDSDSDLPEVVSESSSNEFSSEETDDDQKTHKKHKKKKPLTAEQLEAQQKRKENFERLKKEFAEIDRWPLKVDYDTDSPTTESQENL